MKRIGNVYKKIYDMNNLREAHFNARKGKGWYKEVQEVDNNLDYYLYELQQMLINKAYKTSTYNVFTIFDKNKNREVYKLPYFPDRICQWAILQIIEPHLLRNLTDCTYSAIPKRGIHLALKRLKYAIKSDGENTKYCLKLDISKYYPSINQTILFNKLSKLFKDKDLLELLSEIISSTDSGVPIGNYLSQWFGNFYLSEFAHWLKEEKKAKHLFIYMDDIVILDGDKEYLHYLKREIDKYLDVNLKLKVKYNWQVFPTNIRGIDFIGYRVFKDYVLLRKSTYKNLRTKSNKIKYKIEHNKDLSYSEWCSINSYEGWLKWGNCNNIKKKYIIPLKPYLKKYYYKNIKGGLIA